MATADEIRKIIQEELKSHEERILATVQSSVQSTLDAHKAEVLSEAKEVAKLETMNLLSGFMDVCKEEFHRVYEFCVNLEKDSLAAQCHSMKYNLLVGGIHERGVTETYKSMTEDVIKMFRDQMGVDPAVIKDLQFKAIHRLGRGSNTGHHTIIVVVNKLEYIAEILKHGKKLKDSGYTVRTHLPKVLATYRSHIVETRKEMIAKDRDHKVRVIEVRGIPTLQEKRGARWVTVEDYYNQSNHLVRGPRFNPLSDLENLLFSDAVNDDYSIPPLTSTLNHTEVIVPTV